jgi:hypothetical protein
VVVVCWWGPDAGASSHQSRERKRCAETLLFLSLPYVCPEPVLVKSIVFVFKMAQKDAFSYLRHVALVRREVGAHEQQ